MLRLVGQRSTVVVQVMKFQRNVINQTRQLSLSSHQPSKDEFAAIHPSKLNFKPEVDWEEPSLPEYRERHGEAADRRRARLQYQSRKRGITENGLLLSTFAAEYLEDMSEDQMLEYDHLINKPTNDWELYYWATGAKPVPTEFDTEMFRLLKEHAKNSEKVNRTTQPETFYKPH